MLVKQLPRFECLGCDMPLSSPSSHCDDCRNEIAAMRNPEPCNVDLKEAFYFTLLFVSAIFIWFWVV